MENNKLLICLKSIFYDLTDKKMNYLLVNIIYQILKKSDNAASFASWKFCRIR